MQRKVCVHVYGSKDEISSEKPVHKIKKNIGSPSISQPNQYVAVVRTQQKNLINKSTKYSKCFNVT